MSDQTLRAAASRIIGKHGRLVTLSIRNSANADGSKPWRGAPAPSTADPVLSVTVKGVMTRMSDRDANDDTLRSATKKFLVAAVDIEAQAALAGNPALADGRNFVLLTDGVEIDEVVRVITEQPGGIPISYVLYVEG